MKRTKPFFRFRLWLMRPLACKLGFHCKKYNNFSYAICSGVVYFHCAYCEKKIDKKYFDDLDSETRQQFLGLLKDHWPEIGA
jgi:hypothetical protein